MRTQVIPTTSVPFLSVDKTRPQFYRLLQAVYTKERLIAFLNEPCKHGVHGECGFCDHEDYRLNGYVSGKDEVA